MSELEIIEGMVLATLGAGVTSVALAPFDGVADAIRQRVKSRLDRTRNKAMQKASGGAHEISDRVAAKVFLEAAFTDDDLTLEYLAGVMAASGRDDAGAAVVAQIARLSALQLRFHYIVYRELRRLWPPQAPMNLYMDSEAAKAGMRLPAEDLLTALGARGVQTIGNIVPVLHREGLIAGRYDFGAEAGNPQLVTARVRPSSLGAELYIWGHGFDLGANDLLAPSLVLPELDIPATPGASLIDPPTADLMPTDSPSGRR